MLTKRKNILSSIALPLFLLLFTSCKVLRDSAELATLSQPDLEGLTALDQARRIYDENVAKVFLFIEADSKISDGGEPFVRDYLQLLRGNLGTNFEIYLLSDAKRTSTWFVNLGTAAFPVEGVLVSKERPVTIAGIQRVISQIQQKYRSKGNRPENFAGKKVQVILHFFAHGGTETGGGEGSVLIGEDSFSWREVVDGIISPLAEISDEFIGIFESCFSGNLLTHLSPTFTQTHDALLVIGAPAWATQQVPKALNADTTRNSTWSSPASIAVKNALRGFASTGLFKGDGCEGCGLEPVTFDGSAAYLFSGSKALRERYVVRTDEFKTYVEKRGTLVSCQLIQRYNSALVGQICSEGKIEENRIDVSNSIEGNDTAKVLTDLIRFMSRPKVEFVRLMREKYSYGEVLVFSSNGVNHQLDPKGKNGVLSLIDTAIINSDEPSKDKFFRYDQEGPQGVTNQLNRCISDMDETSGDLYDVLNWLVQKERNKKLPKTSRCTFYQEIFRNFK